MSSTGISEAERHEECVVCFDPLPERPVGMLMCHPAGNTSRPRERVCRHYFHLDCLEGLRKPWLCPLCRKPFSHIENVPILNLHDTRSADAWFAYFDRDHDGELTYDEIMEGLKAQIPLEWPRVEADMDRLWPRWDTNGDGALSRDEFLRPREGFLAYLTANYGQQPRPPPPDIQRDKGAWFRYWDEDHSGALSKEEVARALVKTFKMYHIAPATVLEVLDNIWPIFDYDSSNSIDMSEFCSRDNLEDTIIATLAYSHK